MKSDDPKPVHSGELIGRKDENVIIWQIKDWKPLLRERPFKSKIEVTNI